MKTIRDRVFNRNLILLALIHLAYSCGESEETLKSDTKKYSSSDDASRETDTLSESDLDSMSDAELTNFLTVLKERNKKEAKELKVLSDINQELCNKLADVKKSCTALAPLMSGTYDSLKCSAVDIKNEITVSSTGQYRLVGDNLYESDIFNSSNQKIDFASKTGSKDVNIRFIDLNLLELKSEGGSTGSPSDTGFELKVNGVTMFTSGDLEKEDGKLRIKLSKMYDISKSSACNVASEELDEIRDRVRLSHGE